MKLVSVTCTCHTSAHTAHAGPRHEAGFLLQDGVKCAQKTPFHDSAPDVVCDLDP